MGAAVGPQGSCGFWKTCGTDVGGICSGGEPPLLCVIAEWETSCALDIRAPLQLIKHIKGLHQTLQSRTT